MPTDPELTRERERLYIGRRHVTDDLGDPMVIDWRARMSRPFYRAGPMRDIVATIQPEQDAIVRGGLATSICVQGAPAPERRRSVCSAPRTCSTRSATSSPAKACSSSGRTRPSARFAPMASPRVRDRGVRAPAPRPRRTVRRRPHDAGQTDRTRRTGPRSTRWTEHDAVLIDETADWIERTPSVGHVVLDEAQDLSAMTLRAVARRSSTGSVTALGDLALPTTTT